MNTKKNVVEFGKIFKTNDYSMFKTILGNRGIEASRVSRIVLSITKYGFRVCPIVVNKKMEIIDGQGRFTALKQLGLPVVYVIDEDADIEVCRALNINQKNWGLADYVKSFADSGNEDFKRLLWFLESYGDTFNQRTIIGTCAGLNSCLFNGGRCYDEIREGSFKFYGTDKDRAEELDYLKRFSAIFKDVGGGVDFMMGAVLFAFRHTKINRERFVTKVEDLRSKMFKVCTMEGALRMLTDIYNNALKQDRVYIDHEYKVLVTDASGWTERKENAKNAKEAK